MTCSKCGRRASERNGAGSEPDTCDGEVHDAADRVEEMRDHGLILRAVLEDGDPECGFRRDGKGWVLIHYGYRPLTDIEIDLEDDGTGLPRLTDVVRAILAPPRAKETTDAD